LEGTVIAFASAHKQDSFFDARDRNSLYMKRLLAALNSPDSDLEGLLKSVPGSDYAPAARLKATGRCGERWLRITLPPPSATQRRTRRRNEPGSTRKMA
jgi:hypothetical protein